jgi:hypothetical protein
VRPSLWALLLVLGCAPDRGGEPRREADSAPPTVEVVPLDGPAQLTRISLAIRGVRPTPSELRAVVQDPSVRDRLLDDWLRGNAFGATVRDLHAEDLRVRADTGDLLPAVAELEGVDQHAIYAAMSEAPLVLVEQLVHDDRPYTEVVTADHVWADEVFATIWGLPYDTDGPDWQRTQWTDGRAHAGLLSHSSLWLRHVSNGGNFHRGRANVVARTFLCADFDDRDVLASTAVDVSDPEEVASATRNDPACVSCHQSLDPLAGFFWGYKGDILRSSVLRAYDFDCREEYRDLATGRDYCYPLRLFNPEFEHDWEQHGLRPPGFYGQPGQGMAELGAMIAEDPRFSACSVRRFAGYLTQTPADEVPDAEVARLQDRFVDSGFSARALVRDIVTSQRFLASHDPGGSSDAVVGAQILRPEQLARSLEALTGFAWRAAPDGADCGDTPTGCWGEDDLLASDNHGFRSMFGGTDGVRTVRPTHTPTPTRLLVLEAVAGEAAAFVVDHDLERPVSQRRLLTHVTSDTTDEGLVRAQLVELQAALHGRLSTPDAAEIDALWELWSALPGEPARRWSLTLSAMLRDPAMVLY